MHPIRVFTSFDRDRDRDLHERLIRDSRNADSPFEIADWSGRDVGSWGMDADESLRARIEQVDALIVICGEYTDSAVGVSLELRIAQDQQKPYFLIWGRREQTCTKPLGAKPGDGMYTWIWELLRYQIVLEMRKAAPRGVPT